ncbi:MAG: hypothetical protein ACTSRG_04040 [Candidatus Helarchaeota archaeon]
MDEKPRMKKISPFQTRYLRLLRKIKNSPLDQLLEKTRTGAELLLEKFSEEDGLKEAIGKLWVQSIGVFENIIPKKPKDCANQMRRLATASALFLIDKYGEESAPLIRDVYKSGISLFLLCVEDKELGKRIAKRIAIDGAENVRKIGQEEVAKDILKMPFMKIKPKGSMF